MPIAGLSIEEATPSLVAACKASVERHELTLLVGGNNAVTRPGVHALGLPLDKVVVRLGDSSFPVSAGPGGQCGAASSTAGVYAARMKLREAVAQKLGVDAATAPCVDGQGRTGARSVTHLCNAMRPLHHRDPGVVAAALTAGEVTVELIVDGHHLDDDMGRVIWRWAGDRVALVTDGTAAAGMTDGTYRTGGIVLTVEDGAVRDPRGALAGSALTMIDAVRNLHALGVDHAAAVMAATRVPADLAGRPDLGRLHTGAAADVVVLDDRFAVRETFVAGARVHAR